jgi:uncharacterized Zn-finger protein
MDEPSRRTFERCPHPTHYRCHCELASVELSRDGYFNCPGCKCTHPHPPRDYFLEFYTIGNAFCPYCVRWYIIEGGDGAGIVEIDEAGRRRTRLFTERDKK